MWRRTKLKIRRQLYVTARDECTALISARKMDYFRNHLEKASNKNMFRLLISLDGQRVLQQPEFRLAAQDANYFLVSLVERLTISYQVCSVSTTSIGHQTKDVVSLTVLMCLIEQRTQRSQRFVELLRKCACSILCLQISSLTTSPDYACHHKDHKCFPGRGNDAEDFEACYCPTTFKETITAQRHPE